MAKITISFSLDAERDKRLARWLNSLPRGERSKAIREALAAHLGQGGITIADVYEAIQELKRGGLTVARQGQEGAESDVPADVLRNLSKLGL